MVAAGVLFWLSKGLDLSRVLNGVRNSGKGAILLAMVLSLLPIVVAGWRWRKLLAIFEIQVKLRTLVCIAQIGQLFLMFLPGPLGDDLTRMLYISRFAKGKMEEACTSVLMDRCIGLASILILAVPCIPLQWHFLVQNHQTHLMAAAMLACGLFLVVLGIAWLMLKETSSKRLLMGCANLIPMERTREKLKNIISLICENRGTVVVVAIAAITTQILLCAMYKVIGDAVGVHLPLRTWLGFAPIILAANAVPVTIAGLGVREYLLILFLGVMAHVQSETALAASVIVLFLMVVSCSLGGAAYIFYKPGTDQD